MRRRTTKKGKAVIGEGRKAVIQAIREARKRAGLTQAQAADLREGRATSTISHWETGGLPRSWDELSEYAHALKQPIVLRFGPAQDDESAPPEWAERILTGVIALETKGQVSDAELAKAQAKALAYLTVARQRRLRQSGGGGGASSNA